MSVSCTGKVARTGCTPRSADLLRCYWCRAAGLRARIASGGRTPPVLWGRGTAVPLAQVRGFFAVYLNNATRSSRHGRRPTTSAALNYLTNMHEVIFLVVEVSYTGMNAVQIQLALTALSRGQTQGLERLLEVQRRLARRVNNRVGVGGFVVLHEVVAALTVGEHGLLTQNDEDGTEHSQGQRQAVGVVLFQVGAHAKQDTQGDEHDHKRNRIHILPVHIPFVEGSLDQNAGVDALRYAKHQDGPGLDVIALGESVGHVEEASEAKRGPEEDERSGRFPEAPEIRAVRPPADVLATLIVGVVEAHHHRHHAATRAERQEGPDVEVEGNETVGPVVARGSGNVLGNVHGIRAQPEQKEAKHEKRTTHVVHHRVRVGLPILLPGVAHLAVLPEDLHGQDDGDGPHE
eukprot:1150287-Prorocentrum_minimum.AAC.1